MTSLDSLKTARELDAGGRRWRYFSLAAAEAAGAGPISRLPYSLKVLLENLLRHEDGSAVTLDDIRTVARWAETQGSEGEIAFHPTRLLVPDGAGIPLFADYAAMRDAMLRLGGDPSQVNPTIPVDFIIDHSVMIDVAGRPDALARNMAIEYGRNGERYRFVKWVQNAFRNIRVMPPGAGIMHQVNIEHLARVVWTDDAGNAYFDTLLGVDSHTPMVNALGVLGWGVGGIEAAAAALGQPVGMQVPPVVGCRLTGKLPEGATATDLVLTVTAALRKRGGVVGAFVEFHGPALDNLTLPERATLANMAPEYGATMGFFPIDRQTVDYLTLTGRDAAQTYLVEAYAKAQGLWREPGDADPVYSGAVVTVALDQVVPSIAGPKRPQDRIPLAQAKTSTAKALDEAAPADAPARRDGVAVAGADWRLTHGDIAIAAITSCTNTSNPWVMFGAGLLAQKAVARGLTAKPWVKTSMAPGSPVVADYLARAGLQTALDALGFHVAAFGCTTCMGGSGPLAEPVAEAIRANKLSVAAVLSGNRNFEGRIHPLVRLNYLMSPPLVVAYALAGTVAIDLATEPLGTGKDGKPVFLADLWPSTQEIAAAIRANLDPALFRARQERAFSGGPEWQALESPAGETFAWSPESTYILQPPFFDDTDPAAPALGDVSGARILAMLGDSVTTDHISPTGRIEPDQSAGLYLIGKGVKPADFNSFSTRRVNHEVMMRGTFGNVRLRNELVPGTEGGFTRHLPSGDTMPVFDAAMRYRGEGVPLVVIAGREYGSGSSRDWAAKGTYLLGVKAAIAESFERIHRSNLVGLGVLPLQFPEGVTRRTLGLDGSETVAILGIAEGLTARQKVEARFTRTDGSSQTVMLDCRLDTAHEVAYHANGGILQYVLRRMLKAA
ncbi:MAG: aconitate hydratase AcnA [Alphaproteobacteria bacterium]